MKEASFYEKIEDKKVNCSLCSRFCKNIIPENTGFCRVRKNIDGKLFSLVYGKAASIAIDPIEKKPLYHFAPGTRCLSVATVGCNFKCLHCQNWEISQGFGHIIGKHFEPCDIVHNAKEHKVSGIAYTYTEPTVFYEYALDIMKLAKKEGLYNVWVSNGYTSPEAIKEASKYLDAVNIDIKGNDEFYKKICMTPGIEPVFEALKEYKKQKIWTEVTNLVIPGYNDSDDEIKQLVRRIKKNLGSNVPIHFSAFFPNNKLRDAPPTSYETLKKCYDLARKEGMKWVYLGNIRHKDYESTRCPKCHELLIKRRGFSVEIESLECRKCKIEIPIEGKTYMK